MSYIAKQIWPPKELSNHRRRAVDTRMARKGLTMRCAKYRIATSPRHTNTGHRIGRTAVAEEAVIITKEIAPHAIVAVVNTLSDLLQERVVLLRPQQLREQGR